MFADRLVNLARSLPLQASVGQARWTGESERSRTYARQARNGRRVPRAILRESCGGDVGSGSAVVTRRARGALGIVTGGGCPIQSEPRRAHPPAVCRVDAVTRGADVVKLEGAGRMLSRARAIAESNIGMMGHVGLTPQSATKLGGVKAQGRAAPGG